MVAGALERAGVKAEVTDVIQSPLQSRRRAVFKLARTANGIEIGFHAARSHTIVDMTQCLVLSQSLFELAQKLRERLAPIFHEGEHAELHVTEGDNGFDAALRWERKRAPDLVAQFARAVKGLSIARLALNGETLLEDAAPMVTLGGVTVKLPPHAFLQATRAGEAALQARVLELTAKTKTIADLFCGLGTFTFPLAMRAKVHAVEGDKPMLEALAQAAKHASGLKPITTETRDLFKSPLTALELNRFDAVVLDPPRAGAEAQVRTLATSKIRRVAYVSCDAATFARDAAILVGAGFTLGPVTPVDQFLFSSHIELVGGFTR
jgi:23S rRNA (uracil1939-C5)-methyltransferase